ncbi:MAG TPA: hypothetical protein VMK65_04915, partial [Longimicrobiales bacterium]|nr:hypothetical protein [Longimicrobiales bacterium]
MPQEQRVMEKTRTPLATTGDTPPPAAREALPAPAVAEGAPAAERSVAPRPEGGGRPAPTAPEPRTREEAREAISRSRDRISTTLDAIEVRLREKKAELRAKTDIPARLRDLVRGRETVALAAALGAGLLAALLLGRRRSGGEVTIERDELAALR